MRNRSFRALGLISAGSLALASCAMNTVPNARGLYATPISRAPVTANPTPYTRALNCLAGYSSQYHVQSPRIAVGVIGEKTGKAEADGSGRKLTLGASEMAMTAFFKAGARLSERYSTGVAEYELKLANNKLVRDSDGAGGTEIRKIMAGQVEGVDFYLEGGITEMNFNINSKGADGSGGSPSTTGFKARMGARSYVMNVAIDLRLIDATSLEVFDVVSYQKQVVGAEASVGVFDFIDGNMFDLSMGSSGQEPLQLAVRSLIERAVVEFMANLYGAPGPQACLDRDPWGGEDTYGLVAGPTGGYAPAYDNLRTNNAATRADPNRWNSARDGRISARY